MTRTRFAFAGAMILAFTLIAGCDAEPPSQPALPAPVPTPIVQQQFEGQQRQIQPSQTQTGQTQPSQTSNPIVRDFGCAWVQAEYDAVSAAGRQSGENMVLLSAQLDGGMGKYSALDARNAVTQCGQTQPRQTQTGQTQPSQTSNPIVRDFGCAWVRAEYDAVSAAGRQAGENMVSLSAQLDGGMGKYSALDARNAVTQCGR